MSRHASAAGSAGGTGGWLRRAADGRGGTIAARLVLFAILLASLTATLIGTLSYTRARRALEHEARARLTLLARDVAEHLRRELDDRAADVTGWGHLEIMRAVLYHDVDKELARFLGHAAGGRALYRGVACVDADGTLVAAAGDAVPLPAGPAPERTRLTMLSSGSAPGDRVLRLEAAVTNPDQPGSTIGALVALLDPERLLDLIRASLGPTTPPPFVAVRGATGDVILAAGDETGRTAGDAPASAGEPVLHGLAPLGPLANADGPALEVLVAEPARVALAGVMDLRATLLRVGLVVLVVGWLLGALVAWRISVPIGRLTETVRTIAARRRLEGEVELPQAGGEVGVLAAAFRTMMESLEAAQAEALVQSRRAFLGEIAANIAHEVRTPLSVLKTSAQLLARQTLPPDEQRTLATTIAAEVDRLNGVVTSLVDLARPMPVRYRSESLAAIVDRAVALFRPQAAKLGVDVAHEAPDVSVRVHADADQLHQVLLNLIHNALQAMAGPGRLRIRCYRDGGWGVVEVEDTGPGFPPETLGKPFAPFSSTKADGTGLGLAISKRIVEEHGGTIAMENVAGGGARLRVRLPERRDGT